jgi:hypothetical protein
LASKCVIAVHDESCGKQVGGGWKSHDMTRIPENVFVLYESFPLVQHQDIRNAVLIFLVRVKFWLHSHIWFSAVSLYIVFFDHWDRRARGLEPLRVTGRFTVYCS